VQRIRDSNKGDSICKGGRRPKTIWKTKFYSITIHTTFFTARKTQNASRGIMPPAEACAHTNFSMFSLSSLTKKANHASGGRVWVTLPPFVQRGITSIVAAWNIPRDTIASPVVFDTGGGTRILERVKRFQDVRSKQHVETMLLITGYHFLFVKHLHIGMSHLCIQYLYTILF
jgi:hypothetical protein